MTEIHHFERVMRSVASDTMPARDSERRVIIDVKRGRAVDRIGILDFMREFKYFIVSNHEDPSNEATDVITLTHRGSPGRERRVNVEVNYTAWCPAGREKQLAEALHHGKDPGEELNGLITKWVLQQVNSQNGSLMASPPGFASLVEGQIRTKAQSETGLTMAVRFALIPPEAWFISITETFPVRAKDYYREETLTASLDLVSRPRFSGIPYPEAALRDSIRTAVQDYFAHEVALRVLWRSFNTDDFNQRLKRRLNEKLEPSGYEVSSLSLERTPQEHDEPYSWLAGIQIEVGDSEGQFETSISNLFVNLSLWLRMDLNDIEAVKPLLETQQHVPALIKRGVVEVTRQLVGETNPADIYGHSSQSDTLTRSGFESALKGKLAEKLASCFDAKPAALVLRVGETEITKALAELQKERCEFKVLIPRNRRNAEDCLFRGYFKVDGVDRNGWEEFRRTLPGIVQVKERLEAAIGTALENDRTALIDLKHTLSLNHVQEIAEKEALGAILNDFGLRVTITNIGSDDVESEKKIAEGVIRRRTDNVEKELNRYFSVTALVTEEIRKLEHDIVIIKATGGPDEAIQENQRRIAALREHSPIDPIISSLYYEDLRGNHSSEQS